MRRFSFRLQSVLRHRRAVLREKQRDFGRAGAEQGAVEEQIRHMRRSREEHQELIRRAAEGRLDRSRLVRLHSYVNSVWMRLLAAGGRLREMAARTAQCRAAMIKAQRDVRALEKLREKAWGAWQVEAEREERAFLDEVRPTAGLLRSVHSVGGE